MQNRIVSVIGLSLAFMLLATQVLAFKVKIDIGDEREFRLQSNTFIFGSYINQGMTIDSAFANNSVLFELSDKLPHGLYQVMIYTDMKDQEGKYQRMGFDILLSGKDVFFRIEVKQDHTLGMIEALNGENLGYYQHFNAGVIRKQRLDAIQQALLNYPKGNEFYGRLINHELELLQERDNASGSIKDAAKYPIAEFYFQCQRSLEMKSLNNVDFSAPLLKHSRYIPLLVFEFLREEPVEHLSASTKNQLLYSKINNLIDRLKEDQEVYKLMLPEIVKHYNRNGRHEVVLYLNENYLTEVACENPEALKQIYAKNESLKKVLVGEMAPNIKFDQFSITKDLHSMLAERVLVVFWESTCAHCRDLLTDLAAVYDPSKRLQFEIVGLSLDTSSITFNDFVNQSKYKWINLMAAGGWSGTTAQEYNVASTPSLFLLDRNKKIIAKPRSAKELIQLL